MRKTGKGKNRKKEKREVQSHCKQEDPIDTQQTQRSSIFESSQMRNIFDIPRAGRMPDLLPPKISLEPVLFDNFK